MAPPVKRADLYKNSKLWLSKQKVTSKVMQRRLISAVEAGHHLEIKPVKPPPPPSRLPAGALNLEPAQNVLILTGDISEALQTNPQYKLAATADRAYREYYTNQFLATAKGSGRLRIWCDCRPSGGTPPQVAKEWAQELGLPWPECFIGQGESQYEFDVAYAAGAKIIVGNINPASQENPGGLRMDQWDKIDSGEVLWINETYWNVQPDMPPITWHNLDGVACNCVATYPSTTEGAKYYSLSRQADEGKFVKGRDSVYVAGFLPQDWAVLK
jgi:hypothetical protein